MDLILIPKLLSPQNTIFNSLLSLTSTTDSYQDLTITPYSGETSITKIIGQFVEDFPSTRREM